MKRYLIPAIIFSITFVITAAIAIFFFVQFGSQKGITVLFTIWLIFAMAFIFSVLAVVSLVILIIMWVLYAKSLKKKGVKNGNKINKDLHQ